MRKPDCLQKLSGMVENQREFAVYHSGTDEIENVKGEVKRLRYQDYMTKGE